MKLAPIVVFAYKRPEMLARTLGSLARNEGAVDSKLIVFCDGPKSNATEQEKRCVEEVRRLAEHARGFAAVEVHSSINNKGLARSVIDGVSTVIATYGKVIVVEDDVEVSPLFLRTMNEGLDLYADEPRVWSIGSWNYFSQGRAADFFLRYPDSIAWATWESRWDQFEQDGLRLQEQLKNDGKRATLDANGRVDLFSTMLQDQIDGKVDSWAIRWTASCVLKGGMNLFPATSLSRHLGFGQGATHESHVADYNAQLELAQERPPLQRMAVEENKEAFDDWVDFATRTFQGSGSSSMKDRVWRALPSGVKQWYTRQKATGTASPDHLAFEPVSRVFGFDRGTPVDRYYIDRFLSVSKGSILGHVMEIEEDNYTRKFGQGVTRSEVLRFTGASAPNVRIGDLTRPDTLPNGELDAFICTQTLNFIYDHHQAVQGLHHALKVGGMALVTVAGLVQISRTDADQWGDFWRYTPQSALRMFEDVFGKGNVVVEAYGNSYAASCLLKGFAVEECEAEQLDHNDPDYPVVITIKARKA